MTVLAYVIIIAALTVGLLYRRDSGYGWLRFAGVLLCIAGLTGLHLSTSRLDPAGLRLEIGSIELPKSSQDVSDGTRYRLVVVSGEIDASREKWYFTELGTIEDWREEQVLEPAAGAKTRRVF